MSEVIPLRPTLAEDEVDKRFCTLARKISDVNGELSLLLRQAGLRDQRLKDSIRAFERLLEAHALLSELGKEATAPQP